MFGSLRTDLAFALDEPLVCGHLFESHGASRPKLLGGYADFSTHAELCAIGEACGSIPLDAGSIHFLLETVGGFLVASDDGLTMSASIAGDVTQGFVE